MKSAIPQRQTLVKERCNSTDLTFEIDHAVPRHCLYTRRLGLFTVPQEILEGRRFDGSPVVFRVCWVWRLSIVVYADFVVDQKLVCILIRIEGEGRGEVGKGKRDVTAVSLVRSLTLTLST